MPGRKTTDAETREGGADLYKIILFVIAFILLAAVVVIGWYAVKVLKLKDETIPNERALIYDLNSAVLHRRAP